ncbi:MAG: phage tail length tape measure family protein [Alphaproteobacteria bacterium]|nr:phage tail length tape measure family protein [Alphaproteobacteria bacterium]
MPDDNLKLSLSIIGFGAVPAFRAVRRAIQAVTDAAGEQQQAVAAVARRIEGLGNATELSTPSLARMASELQRVTTASDEQILSLQSALLTFRELEGLDEAAFRRVTETVLDMAAAMGIDAPSAARQLALAIEDPESGLGQLRDASATFTEQQRETIEGLVETGRRAEALGAVLDVLEGQVGGSARALRDTLPSALDSLDNAFRDLFTLPAENTRELQDAIEDLVAFLEDPGTVRAAQELGAATVSGFSYIVDNADTILAVLGALSGGLTGARHGARFGPYGAVGGGILGFGLGLAGADAVTPSTTAELREALGSHERRFAELVRSRARYSPDSLVGREVRPQIDEDLPRLAAEIVELRAELARRTLEAIPDDPDFAFPPEGARGTRLPGRRPAFGRVVDRAMTLTREAEAVSRSAEEHAILNELRGAGVEATIGQYEHIDAYVARLSDEERALALAARHFYRRTEAVALSAEVDREAVEALEERARAEEEAARQAIERGREIAEAAERARREALGPLGRGLEDYARDALDAAGEIQLATEQAFAGMEGALVDFVRTGEFEFRRFADFVIAELARIAVQRAITGPLSAALGGLLGLGGGSFRGVSEVGGHLFHSGGVAGAGTARRYGVDPRAFIGAPRFPHSGIAGDEVPAILRRGETVHTPEQERALGGPPNIEVRLINEGGTPQEATDDGVRWDGEKFIVTVLLRDARANGPVTQAFRHAVSRRP